MVRYFIEVAYHGKNYFGWQRQPEQISVQQVLEESLSVLLRTKIKLVGAGRTDSGVHAKRLIAHFDHEGIEDKNRFIFRMNSFLPSDIAVIDLIEVKSDAHARFDALERTYEYHIAIGKNPFLQDFAYQVYNKPCIIEMNRAAALLLQHTDFKCFSRSRTDVRTYDCDVKKASWKKVDGKLIFTVKADRFLRNMVRAIVGTLLDVGYGKRSVEDFQRVLSSRSREEAGASAPAHGLYLTGIAYPDEIFVSAITEESGKEKKSGV